MAQILVVLGPDPKLRIDLASFRAVRESTGLEFIRLHSATFQDLATFLDRTRLQGQVPYVHFAMHMGAEGFHFEGGVVSVEQVSEVLQDVPLVVLAGCESASLGDRLGVVPYVVSLLEPVGHDLAASFTQVFWTLIGRGMGIEDAFKESLTLLPRIREFAYLHEFASFLLGSREWDDRNPAGDSTRWRKGFIV